MNAVEKIIKMGGVEWKKGNIHRFYFNNLNKWIELELEYYNTGNISNARYEGSEISNCAAKKIMGDLADSKVWFDVSDEKFYYKTGFSVKDDYYAEKAARLLRNEFLKQY